MTRAAQSRRFPSAIAGRRSLYTILLLTGACARGEQREYIGPADPTPIDRSVARVIVTPTIGTMQADERIDFMVFGRNGTGDSIGVEVNWTATGGDVTSNGQFSAPIPGTYWIVARSVKQPDKADSAQVLVAGSTNPINRLEVNPSALGMKVGQSRLFTAAAYYSDGTPAPVPVFWSASGGSIDANGLYTADAPGDQLVIAVVGNGLVDTAKVRVSDTPLLTSLELAPVDDTVGDGDTRQYLVEVTWSDGTSTPPAIDYGTTGGLIDSTGLFMAAAPPGDYVVTASARGSTTISTARVRVRSDAVTTLTLSPPSTALTPGATQRFSATAKTSANKTVSVSINWQATGGTITTNGTYTAGSTPGTYRVIGTQSGGTLADTAVVVISAPATLAALTLTPGTATLAAGDRGHFVVVGSWSDGSTASPSVTWTATGGSVTSAGEYTAGSTSGSYSVIARHVASGKADTSAVSIAAARLTRLSITPGTTSLTTGGIQQFSSAATWSDGSTAAPSLVWTATGGSVSSSGRFTAGTSTGTFRVIARDVGGTVADTSFVTITSPSPVLQAVVINPGSVAMGSNAVQQFYVSGVWTNGGTSIPSVTWSTNGGSISSTGQYRAGDNPGVYRVIAKQQNGTLADTALVTVTSNSTLTGIALSPGNGTVQPGGSLQFSVAGIWSGGGSGVPPVNYSATGGIVTASGLFTAGSSVGTYRVVATQSGGSLADTSWVTITSATAELIAIAVGPKTSSLPVNGGKQFGATGTWTNGGSGNPSVTWTATGGSITSTGYYTAGGSTGSFRVIAKQSSGILADTATVNVTSSNVTLTSLKIVPADVLVQKGMSVDYKVVATWSDGSTAPPAVTWTTTGGTISSSGRFVAGNTAGPFAVYAQHQNGALADTASVQVMAPTVTRINLSPASVSMSVGGTQQFSASANWSDGVVRPVALTYTATGGTITVGGSYTGSMAGSFMVIAACSCGKADTSSVTTGPSSAATLVSMSVNPSSVTLSTNGTQQFNVSGQWSDGSSSPPPVTYSATGGTISSTGYFTAPAAAGTVSVIATHVSGALADTSVVAVQTAGITAPWFEEDFSAYATTADLLAYPSPKWSGANEDVQTSLISLESSGPPVGGKSMRYTFPNRTGATGLCHDYTIGRNLKFPSPQTEVWTENWVKFDPTFETLVPAGLCSGISANGYKFIFGRCHGTGCGRFEIKVGNELIKHQTVYAPGLKNAAPSQVIPISSNVLPYSQVADGQWHRWRQHMRVGPNGRYRVWFDNTLLYDSDRDNSQAHPTPITATDIYGLALGRNMNQGPVATQSVYWGRVRVWRTDQGW